MVYPIVCYGDVQDKSYPTVISLIELGTRQNFVFFEEGTPIIHYSLFWINFFVFLIDIKRIIIYFYFIFDLLLNKYLKK